MADLPVDLARLWRLPSGGRQGRPAELDIDRVVRTATELADTAGLGAVTLQKVAQTLGFTKMALYRYVGSKDELLDLMVDDAVGPPPRRAETDWRTGATAWAQALYEIYLRRPWIPQVPISRPPEGPNLIGWLDALLQVFAETGLDWQTKLGIAATLSGYVRQTATLTGQLSTGTHTHDPRPYGLALAELATPDRFPEAAKLFSANLFPTDAPVDADTTDFHFGLNLILDGTAALLRD